MNDPRPDVAGRIGQLWLYPVKSCAGVSVSSSLLTDTGLEFDRTWMVVDAQGEFVSQRDLPRMALVAPTLRTNDMVLRAPGMLALHVALHAVEQACEVRVWDDTVPAYDMGEVAAQWFSDFLGQELRLVRFDPGVRRLSDPHWTRGIEAPVQFSDGFALLIVSQSALDGLNARLVQSGHRTVEMARFRPNMVLADVQAHDEDWLSQMRIATAQGEVVLTQVKPCSRCSIANIDPATAVLSPEVGDTLQTYRQDARLGGAVSFGMNALVSAGQGHTLQVGQALTGEFAFV
jgi:uncharacterized protein